LINDVLLLPGVVMLVKGMAVPGGDFHVSGYSFAGSPPQAPLPAPSGVPDTQGVTGSFGHSARPAIGPTQIQEDCQ
jgi:hypothetical protein